MAGNDYIVGSLSPFPPHINDLIGTAHRVLDALHFAFAIHMLFNFLLVISGNPHNEPWVIW